MSSPVDQRPEPTYAQPSYPPRSSQDGGSRERTLPSYNINNVPRNASHDRSSDGEGTAVADSEPIFDSQSEKEIPAAFKYRSGRHLTLQTEYEQDDSLEDMKSPSQAREQASRLDDDLEMLKIERQVSKMNDEERLSHSRSRDDEMSRTKSRRREEHVDEFDLATNPVHEKTQLYKPVDHPTNKFGQIVTWIHGSKLVVRWFFYITPLALILLIPLLLGAFVFTRPVRTVGGVPLVWFMIWLEIVWLSLWLGRIVAKCLPWPIGLVASLFTNNDKKWRDMSKQLELPATLFFWWLAIEISFLPTMRTHLRADHQASSESWMGTTNKVLITFFVLAILNFVEKLIIQLIAMSFHLRTYADRIEINKFQIGSLTKLYKFSKEKIAMDDAEFDVPSAQPASGARTPGQIVNTAAKKTKGAFNKFGDVAGKVAGDFTGKEPVKSSHPNQVVLALLNTTGGSQILARRLYRTFAREESETVVGDDLRAAFDNDEEADAAFSMFDKDMNGDISMEELEAVCVEIGRERKSITASLKDLDSVVRKLDDVFMFIVFVITVLVFISLISTSAAGVLTSAGSAVLGLAWLFQATAQEFLQSIVFVFVKHPFDVGDRISVYGNTGAMGLGDDYFVKKISLLYTEFKKMEGHVVQAPNSYLNTLFILNQRRSGGLAEPVTISIKFGTTLDQIDGLRTKLLEFVTAEKREYQGKILTELRDIVEAHSMNLNVIFFHKSNWQNEGLRLARRNKFICALMVTMQELGIEGPRMRYPGQKQSFPLYLQNVPHVKVPGCGHSGHPDAPAGSVHDEPEAQQDPPFVAPKPGFEDSTGSQQRLPKPQIGSMKGSRARGESLSAMNRRVDFSLGMKSMASGDVSGDVYETASRTRVPIEVTEASREREREVEALRRSLEKNSRRGNDNGRSTSRDDRVSPGNLNRRSTDTSTRLHAGSIHRNRFFGRGRAGNGDEQGMMESGMADIPESIHEREHLDPRSGMVSPRAWRTRTNESNIHPPEIQAIGALDNISNMQIPTEMHRFHGRSQTEDFEMRRID